MAGAVAAFGAWTAGVYLVGAEAGRDDAEAAEIPALMAAISQASEKAGKLQQAIDDLHAQAGAVTAGIARVDTAADEAQQKLAAAGVMAECSAFSERDVRLLHAQTDRLETEAGLADR